MTHVTLVTAKALQIARKMGLDSAAIRFIEEASMLHDIGCCNVNCTPMKCTGELPYICHVTEGHRILEAEGLPKHARVASSHTGTGVFREDIKRQNLPLPLKDYIAETLEEKIISYSDLFFSKNPDDLFRVKSPEDIRSSLSRFGQRHVDIFNEWHQKYNFF